MESRIVRFLLAVTEAETKVVYGYEGIGRGATWLGKSVRLRCALRSSHRRASWLRKPRPPQKRSHTSTPPGATLPSIVRGRGSPWGRGHSSMRAPKFCRASVSFDYAFPPGPYSMPLSAVTNTGGRVGWHQSPL